jgi:hypothetical protein
MTHHGLLSESIPGGCGGIPDGLNQSHLSGLMWVLSTISALLVV